MGDTYVQETEVKKVEVPPVSTQVVSNTHTIEEKSSQSKPVVIKIISSLIFLVAILYVFSAVMTLGIMLVMDSALSTGDFAFSFLQNFPTWGFVPVILTLTSLYLMYIAFKTNMGSKLGFWLGAISITVVPLLVAFTSQKFTSSFLNFLLSAAQTSADLPDPVFIFSVIILLLLIISYKKFQFPNEALSKRVKIFFIVLTLIFLLPVITLVGLKYKWSFNDDFGYKAVTSQVPYHVYKPNGTPLGLRIATNFVTGKEIGDIKNAIQVSYDVPLAQLVNESPKLVVLRQVGVVSDFDLESFVKTTSGDNTSIEQITLAFAKSQLAFVTVKNLEKVNIHTLSYETSDNVLISIASPYISKEDLVQFAATLE